MLEEYSIFKSARPRLVGFASIEEPDLQSEIIPIESLRDGMREYMERGGNINLSHTNRTIGKCVEWDIVKYGNVPALSIEAELYNESPEDKKVIRDIQNGKLRGFSIGGQARAKSGQTCDNRGCFTKIEGESRIWEISAVSDPACSRCTFKIKR